MDALDVLINKVPNLPPAPTVATELLGLFNDPDRDIDRVVHLISHDPSLTAEVLKRCSGAAYGGKIPSDVFEAVNRLGFYEVYCIVVSVVGTRSMAMAKSCGSLDVGRLWRHAVMAAIASAAVANQCMEDEAVAFTSGLLHDVGKLIFASAETNKYNAVLGAGDDWGKPMSDRENIVFGTTHSAVGARLLSRWNLPPPIIVAVLNHHGSPVAAGPFEKLAACVHFGNLLAHSKIDGQPPEANLLVAGAVSANSLGLRTSSIPGILKAFEAGLKRSEALLRLEV